MSNTVSESSSMIAPISFPAALPLPEGSYLSSSCEDSPSSSALQSSDTSNNDVSFLRTYRPQIESAARFLTGFGVYLLYVKFQYKGRLRQIVQNLVLGNNIDLSSHWNNFKQAVFDADDMLPMHPIHRIWAKGKKVSDTISNFVKEHHHLGLPANTPTAKGILLTGVATAVAQSGVDAGIGYLYDGTPKAPTIESVGVGLVEGVVGAWIPTYLLHHGWLQAVERAAPTSILRLIGSADFSGTTAARAICEVGILRYLQNPSQYDAQTALKDGFILTFLAAVGGACIFPVLTKRH